MGDVHRVRACALAAIVAAVLVAVGPANVAAADDTDAPELVSISVSPKEQTVSGFELGSVRVEAHIRDETGMEVTDLVERGIWPALALSRVGETELGHPRASFGALERISGDPTDGVWAADVPVPSTWDGRWRVDSVLLIDTLRNETVVELDPDAAEASFTVRGEHVPALSFAITPRRAPAGTTVTLSGRLWYPDTGEPIADRVLAIGHDNVCVEGSLGGTGVRTDANGEYSYAYPRDGFLDCVFAAEPAAATFTFDQATIVLVASGHGELGPAGGGPATDTRAEPRGADPWLGFVLALVGLLAAAWSLGHARLGRSP